MDRLFLYSGVIAWLGAAALGVSVVLPLLRRQTMKGKSPLSVMHQRNLTAIRGRQMRAANVA